MGGVMLQLFGLDGNTWKGKIKYGIHIYSLLLILYPVVAWIRNDDDDVYTVIVLMILIAVGFLKKCRKESVGKRVNVRER